MAYRLGIALSGGGVRGVAHIGVLQALTENGISADCIAGTSSGALVGAFYAAGATSAQMLDFFTHRSPFKFSKLTMAGPGLIDTQKVYTDLREYLPAEDSFAALGKRLFVTATDVVNGKAVLFESGRLTSAVLASSAIPGVFTPFEIEGRWYADGGVLNNFPVEPLQGRCDVILGVYASPLKAVARKDLHSALSVLERALDIGVYLSSKAKLHECDVLIHPRSLCDFPRLGTKHVDDIYEIGYRAGLEKIPALREALDAIDRGPGGSPS